VVGGVQTGEGTRDGDGWRGVVLEGEGEGAAELSWAMPLQGRGTREWTEKKKRRERGRVVRYG
jgi:hypothetical protein